MKPEPLSFEQSVPGRVGHVLPDLDVPARSLEEMLPQDAIREAPAELPEMGEVDIVRHFVNLSRRNYGVDTGFYPLGSCTMKYNPKINEDVARYPGFAFIHPLQPESSVQGALQLMYELEQDLAEITGMDRVTLQPAAGAHGEFTGMSIIRAYHENRGQKRTKVLIPDSAHGTNPATAAMLGYQVVTIPSDSRGGVDVRVLRQAADESVAALMLTNPNTLGLFDEHIKEIADIVHGVGGLLYYDGANANAILGYSRPGDMGFDVVHLNLHKTFSTPHGGGGPGAGPVGVKRELAPFLPTPTVEYDGSRYYLDHDRPLSIGKVRSFYGNFGVLVRAYAYIRAYGPEGLKEVSEYAVLNANYVLAKLKGAYDLPFERLCKHEFVISAKNLKTKYGVRTLDVAKRILDHGYHPPTIYFPLIVEEALMIEPTESESKQTLDGFVDTMLDIAREAELDPEKAKGAPYATVVGRLDEATAARKPNLRYRKAL
ncbi:MAG: aminomethyl-transferring glycine dehydrogenase subunit GcvPB [Bacillota bacterium]